jgi:hypothetical protein
MSQLEFTSTANHGLTKEQTKLHALRELGLLLNLFMDCPAEENGQFQMIAFPQAYRIG